MIVYMILLESEFTGGAKDIISGGITTGGTIGFSILGR